MAGKRMNLGDLGGLLDYHYGPGDRLLDAVEPLTADAFTRDLGNSFRSVRDTLTHIYFAEWAWHLRWKGQSPTAPLSPDQFPDVASIREAWAQHEIKVRAFLENLGEDGIDRVIEYKLTSGQPGAS